MATAPKCRSKTAGPARATALRMPDRSGPPRTVRTGRPAARYVTIEVPQPTGPGKGPGLARPGQLRPRAAEPVDHLYGQMGQLIDLDQAPRPHPTIHTATPHMRWSPSGSGLGHLPSRRARPPPRAPRIVAPAGTDPTHRRPQPWRYSPARPDVRRHQKLPQRGQVHELSPPHPAAFSDVTSSA